MNIQQALNQVHKQQSRRKPSSTPAQKASNAAARKAYSAKSDAYFQTEAGKQAIKESSASWISYGNSQS